MRTWLVAFTLTCVSLSEAPCSAQTVPAHSETVNTHSGATHVSTTGDTCDIEHRRDIASYPNCVFQDDQGNLLIAQEYVKELEFDSHGLAVVFHDVHSGHQFMYVNRQGRVIIKDVPTSDN